MKNSFLPMVLFIAVLGNLNAQVPEYDSSYRPRNYSIKVDQFEMYPNSKQDILFLGNSITAGTDWSELLNLSMAKNRGISGDITFGILERLKEIYEGLPSKVFILIGINDISKNIPDDVILNNYKEIVEGIQSGSPRTKIYVQTILPVNNTFSRYKNHYNKDEHINAVNEGLKKMAKTGKFTLIDLHPNFLDNEGRLNKKYTEEGLHLNAEGYKHWAKILKPYLSKE